MSGLFGSITIKGNRLTDLVGQTSTVGKPIPFGYGRCKIVEPNVIWTAGIPKEHVKKKKQGKGGVKTEEYTYTLSYAIAFMEGPIHGYLIIKRGGKVVYTTDPTAPVEDQAYAAKWQQKVKFYYGTEDQMPDATIESYVGAGQVSAFRGLAYIVVEDDDVTSEGGAVPQYEAVILASPPEVYVTSHPYPLPDSDSMSLSMSAVDVFSRQILQEVYYEDEVELTFRPLSVSLVDQYNNTIIDDSLNFTFAPTSVSLSSPLKATETQPESMNFSYNPTNVTLRQVLISAETSREEMTISFSATGVTLT